MNSEVETWADQKVERIEDGAKKKSLESFDDTLTTESASRQSQKKKTSVEAIQRPIRMASNFFFILPSSLQYL